MSAVPPTPLAAQTHHVLQEEKAEHPVCATTSRDRHCPEVLVPLMTVAGVASSTSAS